MKERTLVRYGLKFNPFSPEIPAEACFRTPRLEHFCDRVEHLARTGGFALITSDPGTGKSVALRLLEARLKGVPDLVVRILTRPQASVHDFYRELGALFGVQLSPHNRWAGADVLRMRWKEHIEGSLHRAVLLADEAQEMHPGVLNELRLLASSELDSRSLLAAVLCGDERLPEKFRSPELLSLGTRIRVRLALGPVDARELQEVLRHVLAQAGNSAFMTAELQQTLCERAAGNLRLLMNMAGELLEVAVACGADRLDEKLFLEVYAVPAVAPMARPKAAAKRRAT
jgi:type II secretory pathway predicted ATPase ExeA